MILNRNPATRMARQVFGCDTFVVLPPSSEGCVIFGKNSDRPDGEVQEVVFYPSKEHKAEETLECTYITIPQAQRSHAVILSRPSWLWGAEMGANEFGVCVGNEAVWTTLTDERSLQEEKLLGMDLVRLGLERAKTAESALDVITELLSTYGQGGLCSEDGMTYHNSFLICDRNEAWILETAGDLWVAERVTEGARNISNELTIRTKFHKHHPDLYKVAKEKELWSEESALDFARIFTPGEICEGKRLREGRNMLKENSSDGDFRVSNMMDILRDEESGICRAEGGGFCSTGSQISLLGLSSASSNCPSEFPACHWFTATPDPSKSLYKPFVFTPDCGIGDRTSSPCFGASDPRVELPRFQRVVDRRHPLWRAHERVDAKAWPPLTGIIREMEANCVKDMEDLIRMWGETENWLHSSGGGASSTMGSTNVKKLADIFAHMVDMEMNFYKTATA